MKNYIISAKDIYFSALGKRCFAFWPFQEKIVDSAVRALEENFWVLVPRHSTVAGFCTCPYYLYIFFFAIVAAAFCNSFGHRCTRYLVSIGYFCTTVRCNVPAKNRCLVFTFFSLYFCLPY